MFRFGASHTGVIPGVRVQNYGGFLWRIQTGGTVRSTPAEFGGVLYIGSGDGFLRAINPASGNLVWQTPLGSPITSSPAVTDQYAVVTSQDGQVISVDRKTGHTRWTYKFGPDTPVWESVNGDYWTSSPTIVANAVYVGGGSGDVVSLDLKSGRRIWRFHAPTRFRTTPAVANGMVYLGGFNGIFYALDAKTGHLKWSYKALSATIDQSKYGYDRKTIQSSAAIFGDRVFFGARDGFLYCLNAKTGKFIWSNDHDISWVNTSPAVADGIVYAGSSDKKFLQAVDIKTGKELWRKDTGLMWTAPAIAGDAVFVTDGDGKFSAFDKKSGNPRWKVEVGAQIWTSPFAHGDYAVFGCDDGGIYCFRMDAKAPLRRAVYWDESERTHVLSKYPTLKDGLVARGYTLVDDNSLATFLRDRIKDHSPSTVVMSMALFPPSVPFSLAKQYMAAGGKIVWCGIAPAHWLVKEPGNISMMDIDWKATRALLGVQPVTLFDSLMVKPTVEGGKWGLSGSWLSDFAVDPATVSQVLAKDERGLASAWLKSFGGSPGSGLVRICGNKAPDGAHFIDMVANVAETFPKS